MIDPIALRDDALRTFREYKSLAEGAIAQIDEEAFFHLLDSESNSVAILVKHLSGNLRSRWTDFLTSDGEKPGRHRDEEFIQEGDDRRRLMAEWEAGWAILFGALEPLTAEDMDRTVVIRGVPHTIPRAIQRQIAHYAYHTGQIVLLCKHLRRSEWLSLGIPRGQSEAFNRSMMRASNP
jgi:hypothetical protein